jgi:hypothetical protein
MNYFGCSRCPMPVPSRVKATQAPVPTLEDLRIPDRDFQSSASPRLGRIQFPKESTSVHGGTTFRRSTSRHPVILRVSVFILLLARSASWSLRSLSSPSFVFRRPDRIRFRPEFLAAMARSLGFFLLQLIRNSLGRRLRLPCRVAIPQVMILQRAVLRAMVLPARILQATVLRATEMRLPCSRVLAVCAR